MTSVILLTVAGVLVLLSVVWVVNQPVKPRTVQEFDCDAVSPDGKYRCMDEMAHAGWCHNGDIEWRYDAWAIGSDDYTRQDAPPQMAEFITAPITKTRKRIPRLAVAAGVLAVLVVYNLAYDTVHPKPAEPQYDCDWQVVRCENWTTK